MGGEASLSIGALFFPTGTRVIGVWKVPWLPE